MRSDAVLFGAILIIAGLISAPAGAEMPGNVKLVESLSQIRQSLQPEFYQAAVEFRVPVRVLQAIAYVETRWNHAIPAVKAGEEHEHPPVYGIMGLRSDEWFGRSLDSAAQLIGADVRDVQLDPRLNIRGAAAYLRKLAEEENAVGARAVLEDLNVGTVDVGQWAPVIRRYSGIPDEAGKNSYVREVFKAVESGVRMNGIEVLAANVRFLPEEADVGMQAVTSSRPRSEEYHPAIWDPSPNFGAREGEPVYIVIHTTQGSFAGASSWLKDPKSKASSHYIIRSRDGFVEQLVQDEDTAWHARCWNRLAIGIEHEGFLNVPEYYTDAMYLQSANLVSHLARKFKVPIDRLHIIGHDFGTNPEFRHSGLADLNCNDHGDPGPHWDWDRYLELVDAMFTLRNWGGILGR